MTRQPRRAETALRAAADSEVTPYADEAYLYLAKAALQRGDVTAAERALTEAVGREAGPATKRAASSKKSAPSAAPRPAHPHPNPSP